jgi:hypothetical protein
MEKIYYEKLFPSNNYVVPDKLYLNNSLKSFATPLADSKKIIKIIDFHCKSKNLKSTTLTIVDATGGGGSDTISFSYHFQNVISIEMNKEYYNILKNNVNCYNLKNIITINGDSLEIIPKINFYDILYIDPPWGGKDYKNIKNLSLTLSDISLENVIINFFDELYMQTIPIFIVLKLPTNYNLKKMFYKLELYNLEIYLYELRKKNIVIIQKKV